MFLFQTRIVHRHSCYILTIIVSSVAVKIHIKIAHFMRFFAIKITFKRGFYYIIPEMKFQRKHKSKEEWRYQFQLLMAWKKKNIQFHNRNWEIQRKWEELKIFILLYFVFDMCRKSGNEMICKWIKKSSYHHNKKISLSSSCVAAQKQLGFR